MLLAGMGTCGWWRMRREALAVVEAEVQVIAQLELRALAEGDAEFYSTRCMRTIAVVAPAITLSTVPCWIGWPKGCSITCSFLRMTPPIMAGTSLRHVTCRPSSARAASPTVPSPTPARTRSVACSWHATHASGWASHPESGRVTPA